MERCFWESPELNLGPLGEKQECYLSAMQPLVDVGNKIVWQHDRSEADCSMQILAFFTCRVAWMEQYVRALFRGPGHYLRSCLAILSVFLLMWKLFQTKTTWRRLITFTVSYSSLPLKWFQNAVFPSVPGEWKEEEELAVIEPTTLR